MNYLYISIISLLIVYACYNSHQAVLHRIKLEKKIQDLLSARAELLIVVENFRSQNEENSCQINNLNYALSQRIKELSESLIEANNLKSNLKETKTKHIIEVKVAAEKARKDALKKSRAVLRGQASEHLAPYVIPNTNPKDYRFMGNPIDYICFEGLSNVIDGKSNEITQVRFIDIKTGKSKMNKTQRRIRDAVLDSRVSFEVINLDKIIEPDTFDKKEGVKKETSNDNKSIL